MKQSWLIRCGLLVALATLLGTTSALAQGSEASCADANKKVSNLEDQKKMWEAKKKRAQDSIDDDKRHGRPIRQSDLDAIKEADDHLNDNDMRKGLNTRIKDAQKEADAACKKEEESCGKKKMTWCHNEHRCVDHSYFTCNHCGCGVTR